jgi:hypothetical protein
LFRKRCGVITKAMINAILISPNPGIPFRIL